MDQQNIPPWLWGYKPGDHVRIVDGTFAGMPGEVLSHEQALDHFRACGQLERRRAREFVWVLLQLFGRPVPVEFLPQLIEHAG
jgi:transcription antitermination factor NusG